MCMYFSVFKRGRTSHSIILNVPQNVTENSYKQVLPMPREGVKKHLMVIDRSVKGGGEGGSTPCLQPQ